MRARNMPCAESKEREFIARAARGAQSIYAKEHAKTQKEIKEKWFYAAAYRHTPAEVGGIRHEG